MQIVGGIHRVKNALVIFSDVIHPHQVGMAAFFLVGLQTFQFLFILPAVFIEDFQRAFLIQGPVVGKKNGTECTVAALRQQLISIKDVSDLVTHFISSVPHILFQWHDILSAERLPWQSVLHRTWIRLDFPSAIRYSAHAVFW